MNKQVKRRKTQTVRIGKIFIGSGHPIAIQSMAKCRTSDVASVAREIKCLESCGCEIIRLAVKDMKDARALKAIRKRTKSPLVADIHFNWRLAMESIYGGVDKIRLNPGNIYKKSEVMAIAAAAKAHRIPIRVGLNSGSFPAGKMVYGALNYIKVLEKTGLRDIVISLKASSIIDTVSAYRKISGIVDYPLHLGLTATGLPAQGAVKSSVAIGALLLDGIGDTIRVSLTAPPEEEIGVAKAILESLGIRRFGPEIISCPTCGRCEVNLVGMVKDLEKKLSAASFQLSDNPMKVAVMGCVVNGPGEAKDADIGVAFGKKEALLFKKGKPVKKISARECVGALIKEIKEIKCRIS